MKSYTFSEARQNFAAILEQARQDGSVRIQRRDGQSFIVMPEERQKSPLDVKGVSIGISSAEIVQFIHEGRREY